MRAVLQRVARCVVSVEGCPPSSIGRGLLLLLGFTKHDRIEDLDKLLSKIVNLRLFVDEQGKMNRSLLEVGGGLMVVSQFTLYADCSRGRRPSFEQAAPPAVAEGLYKAFLAKAEALPLQVSKGFFGARMAVELLNDGPVTIVLEVPPEEQE